MKTPTRPQTSKTPAVGGNGRSTLTQAIFRLAGREEANQKSEESTATPPGDAANLLLGEPGDSSVIEGRTGEGEGDEVVEEEFYAFGEKKFTPAQLEEVLKDHETYQRYNQSVKPLIESISKYTV